MAGIRGPGPQTGEGADALITKATTTAAEIVAEANAQKQEMIDVARLAGQNDGFREAEHVRSEIALMEQRMLQEVDGETVRTALRVAVDLLNAEMHKRPDSVVDIAMTALSTATGAREVYLRVHPSVAGIVRKNINRLRDALSVAREVDVREDRKVPPGGVLIQTESGVVDATIETQVAEIARVLGA